MTAEPSAFDRVLGYGGPRDTPNVLGTELPGGCPMCHRLADVIDLYRKSERISEAEISALRAEVQRLRNRYERTTP